MKQLILLLLISVFQVAHGQRVVAYVPTLSDACPYAQTMMDALDLYFAKGLAFENLPKQMLPTVTIIVNDVVDTTRLNRYSFKVVQDPDGRIFKKDLIALPATKDAASMIQVFDSSNRMHFITWEYMGQASLLMHLKWSVQQAIEFKEGTDGVHFIDEKLEIGSAAPDFTLGSFQWLSGLYAHGPVVLYFMPMPFSCYTPPSMDTYFGGAFAPVPWLMRSGTGIVWFHERLPLSVLPYLPEQSIPTTYPIDTTYKTPRATGIKTPVSGPDLTTLGVPVIMITSSTQPIFQAWQDTPDLPRYIFFNDNNDLIRDRYKLRSDNTFKNQAIVVIDKNGKIAYANPDYKQDDAGYQELREKLAGVKQ